MTNTAEYIITNPHPLVRRHPSGAYMTSAFKGDAPVADGTLTEMDYMAVEAKGLIRILSIDSSPATQAFNRVRIAYMIVGE